jgi:hypothetical protein
VGVVQADERGCCGDVRYLGESAIAARFKELQVRDFGKPIEFDRDDRFHTLRPLVVRSLSDEVLAEIVHQIGKGQGGELNWVLRDDRSWCPPSLHSVYSSCGLAINAFGPWACDPSDLPLYGSGFESCRFEVKLRIRKIRGWPPNLDVVLANKTRVVAIESKLLETLKPTKPASYQESYKAAIASLNIDPSWHELYRKGHEQFCYVGVGQLFRHYLGLKTQIDEGGLYEGRNDATLLYLFWEPNAPDAEGVVKRHREEVADLLARLKDPQIRFEARGYRDLWDEWAKSADADLKAHVALIEERYGVSI